jgi:hypothetical protein
MWRSNGRSRELHGLSRSWRPTAICGERYDLMGHQRPGRTGEGCNPKVDCTLRLLRDVRIVQRAGGEENEGDEAKGTKGHCRRSTPHRAGHSRRNTLRLLLTVFST